MPVQIDTATDHVDLMDRLVTWLQESSNGPGWTLLRISSDGLSALFQADGLTSTEEIFFGINLNINAGADAYAIGLYQFEAYNELLGDLDQPGISPVAYVPIWDGATPYWFVANAQRLVLVASVSTVYSAGHAGKLLPYGTPGEWAVPYYVGGCVPTAATRWSTSNVEHRCFFDPGINNYLNHPGGEWVTVQNFRDFGGQELTQGSAYNIWPYSMAVGSSLDDTRNRYRQLRQNVDGTYPLWEIAVAGQTPNLDIFGTFDGVRAVTGFGAASEDIVQEGGHDWLVVQNLFRTNRWNYAAIRLD